MLIFITLFFLFYIFICVVTLKQIYTVMFMEGWPLFDRVMVLAMSLIGFMVLALGLWTEFIIYL